MSKPNTAAAPGPKPGRGGRPLRWGPLLRGSALVAAGMLIAAALGGILLLAGLRFDGGRLARAALTTADLFDACRPPLVRRLAERGFQPDDVEFGPEPVLGPAWARERSLGDSFTFRDGIDGPRVDGVMACAVASTGTSVEFRVAANPHRPA